MVDTRKELLDLPFSDEFDEDNQMAKDHTIAYGIWKKRYMDTVSSNNFVNEYKID